MSKSFSYHDVGGFSPSSWHSLLHLHGKNCSSGCLIKFVQNFKWVLYIFFSCAQTFQLRKIHHASSKSVLALIIITKKHHHTHRISQLLFHKHYSYAHRHYGLCDEEKKTWQKCFIYFLIISLLRQL